MEMLNTHDGLLLCQRRWPLDGAIGQVLIVHGLGEHSGRYGHVAQALNAAGWAVTGYDQRGHGRSGGERGVISAPDNLCRDLALAVDAVRATAAAGCPLLLLGHSLGGLLAARFVAEALSPRPAGWSRPVDGLVLSSPALDPGLNAVQKLLLVLMGGLAPDLPVGNGLKPPWISRDPLVVQAYRQDPGVHDRVTARLVRFIVDSGRLVRDRAASWTVPTLLVWAGADRCVAPAGSAAFAAAAPPSVVHSQVFAGLYHEIFNEPEQARVFEALGRWLDRYAALAPTR